MAPHLIKQIAAGRRKSNMTRKEYFDHRFRIHGSISDDVEDTNQKPHKYIQTQVFDSAFGRRTDGPLNSNHSWCGRDDTTELYFRDWDHVLSCFTSKHVKEVIAPDGPKFADFETSIVLMAYEKQLSLETHLSKMRSGDSLHRGDATVAMYFISTPNNERKGEQVETKLSPLLIEALQKHCQDEVWGLIANIGEVSEKFDLNAYFGGSNMPQYAVVYKVFLKDSASVTAFRKSQTDFEKAADQKIDASTSFVVFSKEAMVLDVAQKVRFSPDRQPAFGDLPGPSHLEN